MIGGDTKIIMTTGVKISKKKTAMTKPPNTKYGISPYFRISAAPRRYLLSSLRPYVAVTIVLAIVRNNGKRKNTMGKLEFSVPAKLLRKLLDTAKRTIYPYVSTTHAIDQIYNG